MRWRTGGLGPRRQWHSSDPENLLSLRGASVSGKFFLLRNLKQVLSTITKKFNYSPLEFIIAQDLNANTKCQQMSCQMFVNVLCAHVYNRHVTPLTYWTSRNSGGVADVVPTCVYRRRSRIRGGPGAQVCSPLHSVPMMRASCSVQPTRRRAVIFLIMNFKYYYAMLKM
jgi:hypothetical protein